MNRLQCIRYYRGVVLPKISDHLHIKKTEAHEYCKSIFGGQTRDLETNIFEERLKIIRIHMSELGLWIPEPGEDDNPPYYAGE